MNELLHLPVVFYVLIAAWAGLSVLAVVIVHTCIQPLDGDH